jgi:tetratricopeptide (TPR) repeat protein
MEINPNFAIEAEKLIHSGKTDEAIELCLKGLVLYPNYNSAELLLSMAFRKKQEEKNACEVFIKLKNRLNYNSFLIDNLIGFPEYSTSQAIDFHDVDDSKQSDKTIIEENQEEPTIINSNLEKDLPDIGNYRYKTQEFLEKERSSYNRSRLSYISLSEDISDDKTWDFETSESSEMPNIKFENNLESLAKKLEEISVSEDSAKNERGIDLPKGIISETMAKIYESQGAYEDAKKAYMHLLSVNPDKRKNYESKIKELTAKLSHL